MFEHLAPSLLAVFGEVVEPLKGGVELEEMTLSAGVGVVLGF